MRRKRKIEPIYDNNRKRWKVDIPASASDTNKRIRAWFETREQGREFLDGDESPTCPEPRAIIPPSVALDADTARQRLTAAGLDVTLAEVARAYVEASKILGDSGGTLADACRAYADDQTARNASKTMGEAVIEFMDTKSETLRPLTLRGYRYTLETAFAELHPMTLADIKPDDLIAILGPKKPSTRAMHLRNLRVFWAWVSKAPREWATMKPVDSLEYRKEAGEGDIETLKPAEARALLRSAEKQSPNAAVAYAIAIFGGVRMDELKRLRWRDILPEHIEIGRDVAKKLSRRLVPISPSLRAWLDEHTPAEADPNDFIVGTNWREASKAVRRRAGWKVSARLLKKQPKATRGAWPVNACRHTCASILVATGEPLETLTFQFGHSGGHTLLRRHYVGRMTRKQAIEILSIGPKGTKVGAVRAA